MSTPISPPQRYPPPSAKVLALIVIGIGLLLVAAASLIYIPRVSSGSTDASSEDPLNYQSAVPVQADFAAPVLKLSDLSGKPVALEDYRGKVVLINNWAFWCPPCRAELPVLEAYYKDNQKHNFVIVGIESGGEFQDVDFHAKKYKLTFPVWLDPRESAMDAFKTDVLPSSYVVDPNGRVVLAWAGPITRAMLDQYVTPLLEK
jgi:thiol-disulfide isomerase/thioredoxin